MCILHLWYFAFLGIEMECALYINGITYKKCNACKSVSWRTVEWIFLSSDEIRIKSRLNCERLLSYRNSSWSFHFGSIFPLLWMKISIQFDVFLFTSSHLKAFVLILNVFSWFAILWNSCTISSIKLSQFEPFLRSFFLRSFSFQLMKIELDWINFRKIDTCARQGVFSNLKTKIFNFPVFANVCFFFKFVKSSLAKKKSTTQSYQGALDWIERKGF